MRRRLPGVVLALFLPGALLGLGCSSDPDGSGSAVRDALTGDAGQGDAEAYDAGSEERDAIDLDGADTSLADALDVGSPDVPTPEDAAGDADGESDADASEDDAGSVTTRLVLSVSEPVVSPGETFVVQCLALDAADERVLGVATFVDVLGSAVEGPGDDGSWLAVAPGTATFTCRDLRGQVPDAESVTVDVLSGGAASAVITGLPPQVTAGQEVALACVGVDEDGGELGPIPASLRVERVDGTERRTLDPGPRVSFDRAGSYTASCDAPGVQAAVPQAFEVVPAAPQRVRLEPTSWDQIAGQWFEATCTGVDRYGNDTGAVPDATLSITPPRDIRDLRPDLDDLGDTVDNDPQIREPQVDGLRGRAFVQIPEPYRVRCVADGLYEANSGELTVRPGRVTKIGGYLTVNGLTLADNRAYTVPGGYLSGFLVAQDAYLNRVARGFDDGLLEVSISPEVPRSGRGWFLTEVGDYEVSLRWLGEEDVRDRSWTVVVDRGAPRMRCVDPLDAAYLLVEPGEFVDVRIEAVDDRGVERVTINDIEAVEQADGTWLAPVRAEPGITLIEAVATDVLGTDGVVVCAFMAAPDYGLPGSETPGGLSVRLGPDALDDDQADLDSLADLLERGLAAPETVDAIEDALADTGTFLDNSTARVWYDDSDDPLDPFAIGGVDVDLDGRSDRVRATIVFSNVDVPVIARVVFIFTLTSAATVSVAQLEVSGDIVVRPGNGGVDVTIENIDVTDVSGVSVIVDGGLGTIDATAVLGGAVADALESELPSVLDDGFSNVAAGLFDTLGGLGFTYDLVAGSLGEEPDTESTFRGEVTQVDYGRGGVALGLTASFDAVIDLGRDYPGHPLLSSPQPRSGDDIEVVLSLDLLNQGLAELWSAGYFDTELFDFGGFFEFVEGSTIDNVVIGPLLPPTVSVRDGVLVLSLGAVTTDFLDYWYGEDYADVRFGAELGATPALAPDGTLIFENFVLRRSLVSAQPIDVNRSDLSRVSAGLIDPAAEFLAGAGLNATSPRFDFPVVPGSDELEAYGLPEGTDLVVGDLEVDLSEEGVVFRGRFQEVTR